ncbi:TPA: hypothetical protein ACKRPP_003576 [Proteus mirabilis]
MNFNKACLILMLLMNINMVYADVENIKKYEKYNIPISVKDIIENGYYDIEIKTISNNKYFIATSENEVNKCSIFFKIENNSINPISIMGVNEPICNVTIDNDKLISSWRDEGVWNESVYKIDSNREWRLLLKDSCVGCDYIKRVSINENGEFEKSLLLNNENPYLRKKLYGTVVVDKAKLYKNENDNISNAYLIKGDMFVLTDISMNGDFFQIKYKTNTGKFIIKWIKVKDVLISEK